MLSFVGNHYAELAALSAVAFILVVGFVSLGDARARRIGRG